MFHWLEHEHWLQLGEDRPPPRLRVPGYSVVAAQGPVVYELYRHSFVPYFAEAHGYSSLHNDLLTLYDAVRATLGDASSEFQRHFNAPTDRFRSQWQNLFDTMFIDGLTHNALLQYQKKFEVDLYMEFLAAARDVLTRGEFDPGLQRFRDRRGALRKGVVADYIRQGYPSCPILTEVVQRAYMPRLRNAVGHNSYRISGADFEALDGDYRLSESEFIETIEALQALQNTILWLLVSDPHADRAEAIGCGIISIGWARVEGAPHLYIYQLAPLYALDRECGWLDAVVLTQSANELTTYLGTAPPVIGPITAELETMLETIARDGYLHCTVSAVMPCVHDHDPELIWQEEYYCNTAGGVTGTVEVQVLAEQSFAGGRRVGRRTDRDDVEAPSPEN